MRLFAEIVEKQTKTTGDKIALESVRELNVQLDRLTALMNYLLDVAKIQQGKLDIKKTFFNINSFVEGVVSVIQNISKERKIRFIKNKNEDREIYADFERMGQVLTNLISNAIKYSSEDKEIIVTSYDDKNNVVISVQDFGAGIPKSEQDLIFQRFYRANTAVESNVSGIGLGLYVAMQIVKAHNGKIWVKSVVNKGSNFYFSTPIKKAAKSAK